MDRPSIIDFVTDPRMFGQPYSPRQLTVLKAIYGLPLTEEELGYWTQHTGRATYPGLPFPEATIIAGARSGKDSRIAAPIALYEGIFGEHERYLARGERGTIAVVAQDEPATRTAFRYIRDGLTGSAMLRVMLEPGGEREKELRLTNGVTIKCFPCVPKALRGYSIPMAILDELAFYRQEAGADADAEIQTAIRRGMIGFPSARLVKITTPYLQAGVAFEEFKTHYGQDSPDIFVWRASTAEMNPAIDPKRLAREQRMDPQRYAREYLGQFGDDIEQFLPGAWIERAVVESRRELPAVAGVRYLASVDPSGGAVKGDAFVLSIVHAEGQQIIQDVLKAWTSARGQTVELAAVCAEVAAIVGRYETFTVYGDHYAGLWPEQEFRKVGVFYKQSEFDKSKAYRELEPHLAQGRVALLDDPTQARELRLLERRYKPGGKIPTIDHPKGGHDDCANALAIGIAELAKSMQPAIDMGVDLGPTLGRLPRAAYELVGADPSGVSPSNTARPVFWNRGSGRFWRR